MRTSFTAVLEQSTTHTESFATEPYEAGWASEARWFVRTLELSGDDASLMIEPQISPDGLHWCAEGTGPIEVSGEGMWTFPLRDFGSWLRLDVRMSGTSPTAKVLIYLALKE
jgi:hypothetical protein